MKSGTEMYKYLIRLVICIYIVSIAACDNFSPNKEQDEHSIPFMFEDNVYSNVNVKFNSEKLSSVLYKGSVRIALPNRHLAVHIVSYDGNQSIVLARTIYTGDARLFFVNWKTKK